MSDHQPILEPDGAPVRRTQNGAGLTQREMVMELRGEMTGLRTDVSEIKGQMTVLLSQHHDTRIEDLERWRHRADGRLDLLVKGIPLIAALIGVVTGLAAIIVGGAV